MKPNPNRFANLALALIALWLIFGSGLPSTTGCKLPSIPNWVVLTTTPSAVTYTYEKNQGGVPPAVQSALDKLNRQNIIATVDEIDNLDSGGGDIPDQYKLSRPAAKEAGLPALVVIGGGKVIRVVKSPKTEDQVLESIQ